MPAPNSDSPQIIREAILEDARSQSDEILNRAKREAESVLSKARREVEEMRQGLLEQARAEVARRTNLILATIPVEAGRLRLRRIEALLESILQAARQRLEAREGFDYRKAIIALAAEAIGHMAGEKFVLQLSPADQLALGEGLAEEITRCLNWARGDLAVTADLVNNEGGVRVQDQAGRQVWDNQFASRLNRLWPELRRQIAVETGMLAKGTTVGGGA